MANAYVVNYAIKQHGTWYTGAINAPTQAAADAWVKQMKTAYGNDIVIS